MRRLFYAFLVLVFLVTAGWPTPVMVGLIIIGAMVAIMVALGLALPFAALRYLWRKGGKG